jgi:acyl carrier protein
VPLSLFGTGVALSDELHPRMIGASWEKFEGVHPMVSATNSMSASAEIYGKVAKVLVEALNVDEDDLAPTATLQRDLGAESIDFLDIVFRLEREFGIKIPRGELFPETIFQGDPDFVREGRVTDQGMAELRSRMPYADLSAFDKDRRLNVVSDLFTVGFIAQYVAWKLGAGSNGIGSSQEPAVVRQ